MILGKNWGEFLVKNEYNCEMVIYGLSDWQWYVNAVYFGLLAAIWWWLPGYWWLWKNKRLGAGVKFFLAPVIGMMWLMLVTWILGTIGWYRWWWVYGLIIVLGVVKRRRLIAGMVRNCRWQRWWWEYKVLLGLIVVALVIQMPAIFGSGLRTHDGVRFYFTNHNDGLMHIGFIEAMAQQWPPVRPEINIPLTDYHYFADMMLAVMVRCGLPAVNLFFQYFPLLVSVVTIGLVYTSVREVMRSESVARWVSVGWLLAGDGGFWLEFLFPLNRGREMLTLDNGADQFLNMPYVVAKMFFVVVWLMLNKFWREKKGKDLLTVGLLLLVLTLTKVYWMLLVVSGWLAVLVVRTWRLWREKDRKGLTVVKWEWWWFIIIVGLSVGLLLLNTSGGDKFVWTPLVWPKVIISADHLGWNEWVLREQVWLANQNWWRLVIDRVALIGVAVAYVLGARVVGWWLSKPVRRMLGVDNCWFLVAPSVGWLVFGFNVMQTKGGLNSFNFLIIAAVSLLIPMGVVLAHWWKGKWTRWWTVIVMILLMPRAIDNSVYYFLETVTKSERSAYYYSQERLELLEWLRTHSRWSEIVMVNALENQDVRAASVIPALAGRKTYVSGEKILETHNVDFAEKEEQMKHVFEQESEQEWLSMLRDLGVTWVYLEQSERERLRFELSEVAFANEAGVIVRVR